MDIEGKIEELNTHPLVKYYNGTCEDIEVTKNSVFRAKVDLFGGMCYNNIVFRDFSHCEDIEVLKQVYDKYSHYPISEVFSVYHIGTVDELLLRLNSLTSEYSFRAKLIQNCVYLTKKINMLKQKEMKKSRLAVKSILKTLR